MLKRIASFFVVFPIFLYIFEIMALMSGVQINGMTTTIAFIVSLLIVLYKCANKEKCILFLSIVGITILSLCVSSYFYDASYDGQTYHSAVIKMLVDGWNPIYHPILTNEEIPYNLSRAHIWASHYAKGVECVAAGFVCVTGDLESGKAFNLMLLVSLFCFSLGFLKRVNFMLGHGNTIRILLAMTIVTNPVLINQLLTHYIDFICYSYIVIGLICAYDIFTRRSRLSAIVLFSMCFFAPSIKFNMVFWFLLFLCVFFVSFYTFNKVYNIKLITYIAITVCLGFIWGAFNPYITNIFHEGNPLYPLIGENKIDILSYLTPNAISGENHFYQVNYSLAVNPYASDMRDNGVYHVFEVTKQDIMNSPKYDLQLGGFGIFFFESLLLLICILLNMKKDKLWRIIVGTSIFVYLCLFLLPGSYFARYVPFFYLIPCLLIVYLLKNPLSKIKKSVVLLSMTLLLVDGLISMSGVLFMNVQQKVQVDYIVQTIKKSQTPVYVKSQSVQFFDKLTKNDCKYICDNKTQICENYILINTLGAKPYINLLESDFHEKEMPFLMKRIPSFRLKFSPIEE